jgi:predicted TPR repeat methyltransferase
MILGIVVCVNMVCTGPMKTMLDLVSGSGTISEETSTVARDLVVDIAKEGIALFQNRGKYPSAIVRQQAERLWLGLNQPLLRRHRIRLHE